MCVCMYQIICGIGTRPNRQALESHKYFSFFHPLSKTTKIAGKPITLEEALFFYLGPSSKHTVDTHYKLEKMKIQLLTTA
jgi:hypothetical protein